MSKFQGVLRAVKQVGVKTETTINRGAGNTGGVIESVSQRKKNAFYRPKRTATVTTFRPDGSNARSSTTVFPGGLTDTGRRTRNIGLGAAASGAIGTAQYRDYKKNKVAKMGLPGKKPIGYLKPLNIVDATGQRGPTGGKRKSDMKDISKSFWGVEHATEVHKGLRSNIQTANQVSNPLTAPNKKAGLGRLGRNAGVTGASIAGAGAGAFGGYKAGKKIGGARGATVGALSGWAGGAFGGDAAATRAAYPGYKRGGGGIGLKKR